MKPVKTIEQELLTLRADYSHRIEAIDVDIQHKEEPVEQDFAEQAGQRENDDVLMALDDDAKQTVIQIDNALQRITMGYAHNVVNKYLRPGWRPCRLRICVLNVPRKLVKKAFHRRGAEDAEKNISYL